MLEAKAKDQRHNFPKKNKTQAQVLSKRKGLQENSSGVLRPKTNIKVFKFFFQAFSEKEKKMFFSGDSRPKTSSRTPPLAAQLDDQEVSSQFPVTIQLPTFVCCFVLK